MYTNYNAGIANIVHGTVDEVGLIVGNRRADVGWKWTLLQQLSNLVRDVHRVAA
jgi:hypothetical protein